MSLKLRRPRDFRDTPGHRDDYDVLDGERRVGRIFRSSSAPTDRPWMWTITGAVVAPRLPSHRFCATLDDAKAAFAAHGANWCGSSEAPGGRSGLFQSPTSPPTFRRAAARDIHAIGSMLISYRAQASRLSGSSWRSPSAPSSGTTRSQSALWAAIEHLEIAIDDIDQHFAAHGNAVTWVECIGWLGEYCVRHRGNLAPRERLGLAVARAGVLEAEAGAATAAEADPGVAADAVWDADRRGSSSRTATSTNTSSDPSTKPKRNTGRTCRKAASS
jgi:hypothetical protein